MRYPDTPTSDQVDDYHGTKVPDPYRWLEDTDSEATRGWIEAQNALTRAWLEQVPTRDAIRRRLTELWDHPRAGAPWHRKQRWFQLRNTGLQNQDVLWTMDAPDAEGRVLLDPNTLSEDGTVALTGAAVSDDGRLLAYATSGAGSDWMTWRVREVDTGRDRDDEIRWSKFSGAAWTADGSGFYYAHYDPPPPGAEYEQRNLDQKLSYHRLGTDQADDELVYARPDEPEWGFSPSVTDDGRYLVVHVWQGTDPRNRVYLADLEGRGPVTPLIDEFDAAYDLIGSEGDMLLFRTDLDAPLGRIIAVDVTSPERSSWREVVPQGEDRLERARLVGGRIVAAYLHHASHRIRLFTLDGAAAGEVALPGYGSVDAISGRPEDHAFHFTFTTFTAPTAVFRHDIPAAETALVRPPGVDIDASRLRTEQVFVTSRDGTRVPMFLVHRADVTPDGRRPTLLYGYGGFDIALTPGFAVSRHVWVERGGVLAIANLRGGGEYGKEWHDAGRLANKQNVFDDAIACAEWLAGAGGWTRPDHLAIQGGSNGGLLVGACMTQRPDLFGACVPEVGVMDMLRFHRFTIGWGWTSDYGCADDPEQFAWLHAYSPLHNLRTGTAYPATLVTTGDHDDRVVPGHSFKFAAALQAAQGGDAPALIRIETQAGHGAGKPTGKLIEERTDVLSFLERALGVAGP
jgi:prolyl oligopeptidase